MSCFDYFSSVALQTGQFQLVILILVHTEAEYLRMYSKAVLSVNPTLVSITQLSLFLLTNMRLWLLETWRKMRPWCVSDLQPLGGTTPRAKDTHTRRTLKQSPPKRLRLFCHHQVQRFKLFPSLGSDKLHGETKVRLMDNTQRR